MDSICFTCEGTGTMEDHWGMDSSGNLISEDKKCADCEGSGKVYLDLEAFNGVGDGIGG